jgi:drug/metabolite transporter (DMT)-like permease
MTLRMLIALPFYLWVFYQHADKTVLNKSNSRNIVYCCIYGLFGYYIASWLDLTGLVYLPANLERLILYTYPSIVLLLSVIFLKQNLTKALAGSLALVYIGLFIVFSKDIAALKLNNSHDNSALLLGAALVFASAVSFAIFFIGSELMMKTFSSKLFTSIAMSSASVAIIVHFLISHPIDVLWQQQTEAYYYAAAIAVFCTVLPSFFVASGIKRVGAATGSIVGGISPVFTLLLAFVFLDEAINALQALGFAIVILAIFNLGRLKRRKL